MKRGDKFGIRNQDAAALLEFADFLDNRRRQEFAHRGIEDLGFTESIPLERLLIDHTGIESSTLQECDRWSAPSPRCRSAHHRSRETFQNGNR